MTQYERVVISRYGGSEVLETIQEDLRDARGTEVRIKVLAAGVSWADFMMRHGGYPGQRRPPFTPGYDMVGVVDQIGPEAKGYHAGQMVAALTVYGGYSQYIFVPHEQLILVPATLDPAEAVCLVLNYVTAHQMLHRVARTRGARSMLVHSAAGGVGTGLLDLGRLAGMEMLGTASKPKHPLLRKLGAQPIDRNDDFAAQVRQFTGHGVDLVFDPVGGRHWLASYRCLRSGGTLVAYGSQSSIMRNNIETYGAALFLFVRPGSRRFAFYSITGTKKRHPEWFREDLTTLFQLLEQRRIQPVISERLPLSQARRANELLEQGRAEGKIVLMPHA
jgi:NADPH:quinone reductase-like Zn-dependent oxidoreductase